MPFCRLGRAISSKRVFAVLLLFILIEAVGIGADTALERSIGGLLSETWPGRYVMTLLGNVLAAPFLNATLAVLFLDRQAAHQGQSCGGDGR